MYRDNWQTKLYEKLSKLTPEEVVGLARLLEVELVHYEDDKPVIHDGEQIVLGIFNKIEDMNRTRRRNFMRLVDKAYKENLRASNRAEYVDDDEIKDVVCANPQEGD